jgi:hypothetical protein
MAVMNMIADKMAIQWAGIEHAMKLANSHPAFRQRVEPLVDNYFSLIDEIATELERRRHDRERQNLDHLNKSGR